jgi:tetratricopeptide (TPR) repeat protein
MARSTNPASKTARAGATRPAGARAGGVRAGGARAGGLAKGPKAPLSDGRKNLALRRALDQAKDALAHHRFAQAGEAIVKAASLGPLSVRPTRLLLELALRFATRAEGAQFETFEKLWSTPAAEALIERANDIRNRGHHDLALKRYEEALGHAPFSPEAIYKRGLTLYDLGDRHDAALWLDLVVDVVGPRRRRDAFQAFFVADALLTRAKIELARGHRAKAGAFALKAIEVKPDYELARMFIWDLEHE